MSDKIKIETDNLGRKQAIEPCLEPCPIERGMRLIGGKWKGSILWHLKDEPVRFLRSSSSTWRSKQKDGNSKAKRDGRRWFS